MLSSTVSWASDLQYSYLSSFRQWVTGARFFPLPDVKVIVDIQCCNDILSNIQLCECMACRQVMQNSQLLDKIISVNWSRIDSFDLKTVVSCVFFAIHVDIVHNIHKGSLPSLVGD